MDLRRWEDTREGFAFGPEKFRRFVEDLLAATETDRPTTGFTKEPGFVFWSDPIHRSAGKGLLRSSTRLAHSRGLLGRCPSLQECVPQHQLY